MSGEAEVPFTQENTQRCLCPQCQVQAKSSCVAEKKAGLEVALSHNPLVREDIPGQYCGTGTATCDDINPSRPCSCFDCQVYEQYSLAQGKPNCYYCMNGSAG